MSEILDRSVVPPVYPFMRTEMQPVRNMALDNGIQLSVIDGCDHDVNRLTLMWNGGPAEISGSTSVPSLTLQLMREGSASHSGDELAEAFDFYGSWIKGMPQSHHSSLVIHSLNSRMGEVLPLFVEMVEAPVFPEKALATQRESLAARMEISQQRVDYLSHKAIQNMYFGTGHPLAREDTPQSIRDITRCELLDFHDRILNPSNLSIYMAGRVTPAMEDMINRRFGQTAVDPERRIDLNVVPVGTGTGAAIEIVDKPGARQSAVKMAIPVICRDHPDYIDLRLTVIALGGYFGSRLMSNIREEKGLTYGINAGLYGYREGGVMLIGAQTDNRTVREVIMETVAEIHRLQSSEMDGEELHRLRKYVMSQLASQLDTPFSIMDYYETLKANAIADGYFSRQWDAAERLTPQRIVEIARRYMLTDRMLVAVAGDCAELSVSGNSVFW